jgi:hypothetical protein
MCRTNLVSSSSFVRRMLGKYTQENAVTTVKVNGHPLIVKWVRNQYSSSTVDKNNRNRRDATFEVGCRLHMSRSETK